ncbi:hypothetical protein AOLI_G00230370 [Acnodon oligacanthus]
MVGLQLSSGKQLCHPVPPYVRSISMKNGTPFPADTMRLCVCLLVLSSWPDRKQPNESPISSRTPMLPLSWLERWILALCCAAAPETEDVMEADEADGAVCRGADV